MRSKNEIELLDVEPDFSMVPRRQSRSSRPNATRSRANSRRKIKSTKGKSKKVGGMHQRANKRMGW